MKKAKCHQEQTESPLHHKLTENILRKKPNKEFELLYRQRDQSAEENPIESIIFVKSKHCKPASNNKNMKVHQEFKKIMEDLNVHVSQHQNKNKSQKKYLSTASTQYKTPFSTKKLTKQTQFVAKKHKPNDKDQNSILKNVNKKYDNLRKQKSPQIDSIKSQKKNQKSHLSPKSNKIMSPKPQRFQKQNIEIKKINGGQKLQRKKFIQQKTARKQNLFQFEQESTAKKQKSNQFCQPSHRISENQTKLEIKRNIRSIPLQIQEYILIEDNFERIKKKSLYKLQTKLLSTNRNNLKQLQNKILLEENKDENDIVFDKANGEFLEDNDQNCIERSSFNLYSQREQQKINIEIQVENNLESKTIINGNQKQYTFIEKVVSIQKWWRRALKIEAIKIYLFKNLQQSQTFQGQNKLEQKNCTTPVNLPSAKSLQFNDQVHQQEDQQEEHFQRTNEDMMILKNQSQIIRQKKLMHQKILTNLLKQKKITKDDYQNKIALVQIEYDKEFKDIMGLYKLIKFGVEPQHQIDEQSDKQNIKIIQGENSDQNNKQQWEYSPEKIRNHPTPENQSNEDQIPVKVYKIGDKITSQVHNYVESTKKNKQQTQEVQNQSERNDFISEKYSKNQSERNDLISKKYSKKTNELGEQYFEDFESDSSNDQSPHKILFACNFQEFESQIPSENHGTSLQPNTQYIKMLQQYKQQQLVKMKIDQRAAIQMGAMKLQSQPKNQLDTSILGIHQFLVNFFKFYLHYYKDEFLRFINMPYGYQPQKRLKFIQGYDDTSDDLSQDSDGIIYGLQYIISDDVFDQFLNHYYTPFIQVANEHQKAMIEWSKIHDRAIFECFNEALNNFRPYHSISGPPYIWNCSEKTLTFYFIAEENINEVFEKTQYRLLKWASSLLGLYVDGYDSISESKNSQQKQNKGLLIEEILSKGQASCHPAVFEKRQENLIKEERIELIESMSKWGEFQQQRTSVLYELSSVILEDIAQEFLFQFMIKSGPKQMMEKFE